ncbi:MAG: hypothetical protein PHW69_05115 [Elusimicrobiaceae bacterium]|nr:hypothetical protein [Elusimicrobiaceae bacterium]
MRVLIKRRLLCFVNSIVSMKLWEFFVRVGFTLAGVVILGGLYFWFYRVLKYLDGISIIGQVLPWKLSAMMFLITFSMVAISSLVSAMTTLYYSADLKFLFASPVPIRTLFFEKTVEAALYSSWTLAIVLVPFVAALGRVKFAPPLFYAYFFIMLVPFILLGAAFGIMMSMALMYYFPSSKTRDAVWVTGTLALVAGYMLLRFVQPEKLVNPDAIEVVARYLEFLQAPTARYLPSWWITRGMWSFLYGQYAQFAGYVALLYGSAAGVYGFLVYVSKWVYMKGFSGAQEGRRLGPAAAMSEPFERVLVEKKLVAREQWTLLWKDRRVMLRDVRYWSQIALIGAIMAVYLFSIKKLPLEGEALKTLIAFFNIAVAGFVVASIGLRFTFPAISLEGRSFWLMRSAPFSMKTLMREKLRLMALPSVLVGGVLVVWSNILLQADVFVSVLTVATIIIASFTCCVMGIGLGALFARFNVENIHQIESSAGGFIYMACCLGYMAATLSIEVYPVKTHFMAMFAHTGWDWGWLAVCAGLYIALNAAAIIIPWKLGLKALERHEI